ncbi:hypothetical protein B484DRAFT_405263 [Ochromonadaceae sp. CCMP2298]|nr:hypothetical protein B484DRAFT_405263 [Ochromonadaceae sp. CCMP2298]
MPGYSVILEKRARGRGLAYIGGRNWQVRTFKLVNQSFEYYDGEKLRGTINTAGSTTASLPSKLADGKEFPFAIECVGDEAVLMNASSESIRQKCLETLNRSSLNPNWDNPAENEKYALAGQLRDLEIAARENAKDASAATFGLAGTNAAGRRAKEAAAAQRQGQKGHVIASIQRAQASRRFKEAKVSGDKFAMNEAAAEIMQACVRVHLCRAKMERQKAVKEEWLMQMYARRIQCAYRIRQARRRAAIIRWNKTIIGAKLDSLCRVQHYLRGFAAYRRMQRRKIAYPDVLTVMVKEVQGYVKVQGSAAEPLAIVMGMSMDLPMNHPALMGGSYNMPLAQLQKCLLPTSLYVSPTTVYPVFSAGEAVCCGVNRLDYICVTIVDSHSNNKKDLIGQALVKLANVRDLGRGKPVEVTVELQPLKVEVKGPDGRPLAVTSRLPKGSVTLMITRPLQSFNIASWVWKKGATMGGWNRRWFVLLNGELTYYNSELGLDKPKATVSCRLITHIEETHTERGEGLKVFYTGAMGGSSRVSWVLSFDEDMSKSIMKKWVRVLTNCCPTLQAQTENK